MGWKQVDPDSEEAKIVKEEESIADRVRRRLAGRRPAADRAGSTIDYDSQLVALRDQIEDTSEEDVPALLDHMTRLAGVAAMRRDDPAHFIDRSSPYFAHLKLDQRGRLQDLLLGRRSFVDREAGVVIVDWRDAPVSRLYYTTEEGEEYEEQFGGREVEGVVLVRRGVSLGSGMVRRIDAPQGTMVRDDRGVWLWRDAQEEGRLAGGAGSALRPPREIAQRPRSRGRAGRPGSKRFQLGAGHLVTYRPDRHLREITAFIDPEQFRRITRPTSGVVLVQGGAGSGKTTVALHRVAYLHYQDPQRYRPSRCLVVVLNEALVRYVARVLPSLDVYGVPVVTMRQWAERTRLRLMPRLKLPRVEHMPDAVARLKHHPAILPLLERFVLEQTAELDRELRGLLGPYAERRAIVGLTAPARRKRKEQRPGDELSAQEAVPFEAEAQTVQGESGARPAEAGAVQGEAEAERQVAAVVQPAQAAPSPAEDGAPVRRRMVGTRLPADKVAAAAQQLLRRWEALADRALVPRLLAFARSLEGAELGTTLLVRTKALVERMIARAKDVYADWGDVFTDRQRLERELAVLAPGELSPALLDEAVRWCSDQLDVPSPDDEDRQWEKELLGVDGRAVHEELPTAGLDWADDPLLLRLYQLKHGGLKPSSGPEISYAHVAVDEAQDLTAVELRLLLDATPRRSVTLSGDMAQKLVFSNAIGSWDELLRRLDVRGISLEPLRVSYRSTRQITELARQVLGPLADPEAPVCTRSGAEVELFRFNEEGAMVAFLADTLRSLVSRESSCSVGVITREAATAEALHEALSRAQVGRLRLVLDYHFTFEPGIDVADITQVKGLEFDYVVLPDVNSTAYPATDAARHLFHVAATRAAHQLWLFSTGEPSALLQTEQQVPSGEQRWHEGLIVHEM